MKEPKCKICGGPHYKTFCRQAPRKPIPVYKPLKARVKPLEYKAPTYSTKKPKPLKRTPIASRGKSMRSKLVAEADAVFSRYIRRVNSFNGLARCVTCGKVEPWKYMHNGHYLSRKFTAIRWSDVNCHVQCEYCNVTLAGNIPAYKAYMESKYGEGITESLKLKVRTDTKFSLVDIQQVIDTYKHKLSKL